MFGSGAQQASPVKAGAVLTSYEAGPDPLPTDPAAWSVVPDVTLSDGTPVGPAVETNGGDGFGHSFGFLPP
jgi:hypothetical protein